MRAFETLLYAEYEHNLLQVCARCVLRYLNVRTRDAYTQPVPTNGELILHSRQLIENTTNDDSKPAEVANPQDDRSLPCIGCLGALLALDRSLTSILSFGVSIGYPHPHLISHIYITRFP